MRAELDHLRSSLEQLRELSIKKSIDKGISKHLRNNSHRENEHD